MSNQLRIPGLYPWNGSKERKAPASKKEKEIKQADIKVLCLRCNKRVKIACTDAYQQQNCRE